jgi:hypothetical protein
MIIYDELFSRYRNTDVSILEIGIAAGGSLELWKTYFGPKAKIYGVDIDNKALYLEGDGQITMFQGSQGDRTFLQSLKEKISHIDILIDDGSHIGKDQIATFEELFLHIDANGLYICEDMNNCWHPCNVEYNCNFADYIKDLADYLFGREFNPVPFIKYIGSRGIIKSLNCYTHMIVIEKFPMKDYLFSPIQTGHETI